MQHVGNAFGAHRERRGRWHGLRSRWLTEASSFLELSWTRAFTSQNNPRAIWPRAEIPDCPEV